MASKKTATKKSGRKNAAGERKRLIFGEGLLAPVLNGEKPATIRKYRPEAHSFKKGEVIVGKFKDGISLLLEVIADTVTAPLNEVSDDDARDSGFDDAADARDGLRRWYPDLTDNDLMATVRIRVLQYEGEPVATLNEYAPQNP